MTGRSSMSYYCFTFFIALMYLFLYVPIIVLVLFSFNDSTFPYIWKGFTLRWYSELWHSHEVWNAISNSLIVAFSSVVLSITMGILAVLYGSRNRLAQLLVLFYGTLAIPEIVVAVGLLSFFSFFSIPFGLTTLIAAHTLLGLGYVVPLIYGRYRELDYALTEASMDLGATRAQTFYRIIIPLLAPALLASALLVFVISLDDFIISFFCSGASTQTLPMYIFSMIRSGTTPVVNALSTGLLVVSSFLVLLFSSLNIKKVDMLP
ncbi:MAG TPA: ABC transporter permease [Candidatus Babeliales bacterium]|nr:ABC transporter permease [Candidatus Babeliales bacterium]